MNPRIGVIAISALTLLWACATQLRALGDRAGGLTWCYNPQR